jgi:cell division transport system permease protein
MSRNIGPNIIATLSICVVFFTFAVFLSLGFNTESLLRKLSRDFRISVFLKGEASSEEIMELAKGLKNLRQVKHISYIDAAKARRVLLESVEEKEALKALDLKLFPSFLEVHLTKEATSSSFLTQLSSRLRKVDIVEDVETYGVWFTKLYTFMRLIRIVIFALGIVVLFATICIVYNTIKLMVWYRSSEIEIMKLCGATSKFIKVPFLFEGMILSIGGASLALAVLYGLFIFLVPRLDDILPQVYTKIGFLPKFYIMGTVLAGGILGFLGSLLSLRKVLRV